MKKIETKISESNLFNEWNFEKNKDVSPENTLVTSNQKVWWKCQNGHEWQAVPKSRRTNKSGCHYCTSRLPSKENNLSIKFPELIKEWNFNKNKKMPSEYLPSSSKKVWWICQFSHEWEATISHRTNSFSGCPKCASGSHSSRLELRCYSEFKNIFEEIVGQFYIGKKSYDIMIPSLNLILEFDGHHWHKDSIEKDILKNIIAEKQGYKLLRIREEPLCDLGEFNIKYTSKDKHLDILNKILTTINKIFNLKLEEIKDFQANEYFISLISKVSRNRKTLQERFPEISKFWHWTKNLPLMPNMVSSRSSLNVWWHCPKCKNSYQKKVFSRINYGCPFCKGRKVWDGNSLLKRSPEASKDWDFSKNKISIEEITNSSHLKVWWKCRHCGEERKESIQARTKRKNKCTRCKK